MSPIFSLSHSIQLVEMVWIYETDNPIYKGESSENLSTVDWSVALSSMGVTVVFIEDRIKGVPVAVIADILKESGPILPEKVME